MMKNKKALSLVAALLCVCISAGLVFVPVEVRAYAEKYDYLFNTPEDNAYAMTGSSVETRYCRILTADDPADLRYMTQTVEEGVDSGYFGAAHYMDIRYDSGFYDADDHTLIVSVVFYDYGPGQGTFYIKYNSTDGSQKSLPLIKPGKVQGWFANTVAITDFDFTRSFEDGAHIRVECSSGGKNAFKKVETVNVSKQKREGKNAEISCIGTNVDSNLKGLGFIDEKDSNYDTANLSKQCSEYDMQKILNFMEGKKGVYPPAALRENALTQGKMCAAFLKLLGEEFEGDAVAAADKIGLLVSEDLILSETAPATFYNLVYLAYSALYFEKTNGDCVVSELLDSGFFSDDIINGAEDARFAEIMYSKPRKLPYTKICDQETGRTYYYVNFFGKEMRRTYMTLECWSEDGKGMIVGQVTGKTLNLFYYNIEEQTARFIDSDIVNYGEGIDAIVGCDNRVYYVKNMGTGKEIRRADFETFTPETLYKIPAGVTIGGLSMSNDCRYLAFEYDEPYTPDKEYPKGSELGARLDLETGEWDIFAHTWEFQNNMMHVQINPVYTDTLFFCHDFANPRIGLLKDRIWTIDLSTGEQRNIFLQGESVGKSMMTPTHETWTLNGEKLSFVSFGLSNQALLYMIDRDGSHRRKFENPYGYFFKHCFASGDGKFLASDGHYMTILSTDTEQYFKISRWKENGNNGSQADHPYHPHPIVARNQYLVSWGDTYDGVLGVYWYDFSEIAENEIAKGGHYALDGADRISYEGLECETTEAYEAGRDCIKIKRGKSLYLDIDPEVADCTDGAVTVSFDYLDKGTQPIVLTYTKGIKQDNDFAFRDNGEKRLARRGSGRWKHGELTIDSGNFENPGKFASDIKLSGISSDVYITNISIKRKG